VRTAAEQLIHFHDRFAPTFGKVLALAQDQASDFIKGLMASPDRRRRFCLEICPRSNGG
jgi:hypothetical protein